MLVKLPDDKDRLRAFARGLSELLRLHGFNHEEFEVSILTPGTREIMPFHFNGLAYSKDKTKVNFVGYWHEGDQEN